ncbi:ABC transporter family substrate-binding protein [Corynebacterium urinipleomorphum]|uniref:ABC transporter family substrate-binding protein n=1 Tax=Corynebacterium urinipleomorphum TaxID=1852380 RepID=UPI000B351243|nr:ABC transporter family substrate-binding protein [Corynebacterium urinipleomorphum]
MRTPSCRAAATRILAPVLALGVLSSCSAQPGPPPIVEEPTTTETATTTVQPAARTEANVGVQPLRNGLNPHLAADDNSTVQDLAALTLPSAFDPGGINHDLLVSADVLPQEQVSAEPGAPEPPAMTVRYVIAPAAQWSDGSPVTGADFVYLWRGMVSTPGVIDPAGYRAIRDIQVSGSGKTVDVIFDEPVTTWPELFTHLLPSHLLDSRAADFATALSNTIPASAGRYMVDKVDRGAGVIALKRNDRFWAPDPAGIDLLTLNFVRSTNLTADRIRSGQLAFVDHVPGETSWDAYSLIPGAQLKLIEGPRELGVTFSVNSSILGSKDARRELASLIDVPLISRIAAGRERDLAAAAPTEPLEGEPEALRAAVAESGTLRIAADPRDDQAMPAARALADLLARAGINAEAVAIDTAETAKRLRAGTIDAVVGWSIDGGPGVWASKVQCAPQNEQFLSGNLSGLCLPSTRGLADDILTGRIPADEARAAVSETLRREAVWVPLLGERRIMVLGEGIIGPAPQLENWGEGIAGAARWKTQRPAVSKNEGGADEQLNEPEPAAG